jgi:hypothetical protein
MASGPEGHHSGRRGQLVLPVATTTDLRAYEETEGEENVRSGTQKRLLFPLPEHVLT